MEELQAIIAKMQNNGESDENIGRVIQEYRKRNPDVDLTPPEPVKTEPKSRRALLDEEEARLLQEGILVSDGADTSSELQSVTRGKEKIIPAPGYVGTFTDALDFTKKIVRNPKKSIEKLDSDQRKKYDNYKKLYDEALWEERLSDAKEISAKKSEGDDRMLYNSIMTFGNQLSDAIPNTAISVLSTTDALFGVGSDTLIDLTEDQIISQEERGRTGSLVKGFKEGSAAEVIGGTINAIGSLGASMVINAATRGAGLYTDFLGRGYTTVNKARADKLGISLAELIETDQDDYIGALTTSALMAASERIGLGLINKMINKSVKAGFFKSVLHRLTAGSGEGLTELIQTGLENVQVGIGQQKTIKGLGSDFIDGMNSEEGLEAFLQGFIGGGIITTAAAPKKQDAMVAAGAASIFTMGADGFILAGGLTPIVAASGGRRLKGEAARKREEELFEEMHELKNSLHKTKDAAGKERIQKAIESRKEQLVELTKQSNILINQTPEKDLKTIASVRLDFKKETESLINKFKNNEISENEYNTQRKLIAENYKNNLKKVDTIISDVSKKNQEISTKNEELIKIIKTSENEVAIEKAKSDLYTNNLGFINKLINSTYNPNLDTELTKEDFTQGVNEQFVKLINTYKFKSPFGAYVQKNLPRRLPAIFDALVKTTPEGEIVGTIDVNAARNITGDDLNLEIAKPKTSNKILSKTGVTDQDVNIKAKEILKSRLPGLNEKVARDQNPFLTAIEKASEGKFFDPIYKELGGNYNNKNKADWDSWLENNIDDFLQLVEESGNKDYNRIKNKMLKALYKGKKIGRAKKGEGGTNIGEGRYEYQTPNRQDAIDYFSKGNLTTLVERKKSLTKILAHATGKKGVANVINDKDVQQDFIEIQKLLGKDIPDNVAARITTALDRVIKSIEGDGVLFIDPTFGILANARNIVVKFLKSLKKYLASKGWAEARAQAIKDLNIKNKSDFDLVNSVLSKADESDIQSVEGVEKIISELEKILAKDRVPPLLIEKRIPILVEKINSIKNTEFKVLALKNFLNTHTKIFTKAGSTYKNELKNKYNIEISSNTGLLNFIKSQFPNETWLNDFKIGKQKAIYYKNENLSSVKYNLNNNPRISLVEGKIDPFEINTRAEENKKALLEELDIFKDSNDLEGAFNMLKAMQDDQNTPLRLYPSLNIVFKPFKGYKNPGQLVVEHNPPTNSQIPIFMKYVSGDITKTELISYMNTTEMNVVSKKFDNEIPSEFKSKENKDRYKHLENYEEGKDYIVYNNKQNHFNEKNLDKEFNDILENKTGIKSVFRYAEAKAEVAGKDKGAFDYIGIPPSAQDFMGLIYKMIGKGKQGDLQLAWFKKNLLDPFAKAMVEISNTRVALATDFKQIKKIANIAPKVLKNKLPGEPFTVEQAIRVYIWNKQDMAIDGLSKVDLKTLVDYIKEDTNLLSFANQLIQINKDMTYPKPDKNWLMGTMTTDLLQGLNTTTRKEALLEWQANVDVIFSQANMNKLEAAFGKNYRVALDNMLKRMQSGKNRGYPGDQLTGRFVDWLNGSVGAIMFFNMRSAVLQTISSINFINFTDNNPLKAAAAFANQPQFWKDVMFIMNSDYLVERRNGLKINVNEADIAEIAAESKNKAKAFVNKLLKLGFLPTQIADSFAIATGGASFYRNRVKSYIKKGLSEKEAQDKAFLDFREITEENQQSSRPDRISQQQAGPLGRIILAFANTPAQYARIIQRAASDLKNGRGDAKANISKIIYYGAVQNVIFNAMQQALFAMAFGDEEPDDEKEAEKYGNIVNGMVDSLLRGAGFAGAAVSTIKNAIIKIAKGGNKQDVAVDLINISPPISSKIRKVRSAGRTFDWNKKEIKEKGLSLDNPAAMAIGQLVSATTNVPLDRGIKKLTNIKDALDSENEEWIRIATALGWSKWELEWEQDKRKKKKKSTTTNSNNKLKF